uniref:Uncharacterized protein n=1 Tax=Globisporangium ultimum (strain ATCC 200006 / CBS 805.95 / DAOM BR144) TaxID=431595 RepID=K3XCE4_GLOUD
MWKRSKPLPSPQINVEKTHDIYTKFLPYVSSEFASAPICIAPTAEEFAQAKQKKRSRAVIVTEKLAARRKVSQSGVV